MVSASEMWRVALKSFPSCLQVRRLGRRDGARDGRGVWEFLFRIWEEKAAMTAQCDPVSLSRRINSPGTCNHRSRSLAHIISLASDRFNRCFTGTSVLILRELVALLTLFQVCVNQRKYNWVLGVFRFPPPGRSLLLCFKSFLQTFPLDSSTHYMPRKGLLCFVFAKAREAAKLQMCADFFFPPFHFVLERKPCVQTAGRWTLDAKSPSGRRSRCSKLFTTCGFVFIHSVIDFILFFHSQHCRIFLNIFFKGKYSTLWKRSSTVLFFWMGLQTPHLLPAAFSGNSPRTIWFLSPIGVTLTSKWNGPGQRNVV